MLVFPKDDAPHFSHPMEWWYWHGHLGTQAGKAFGFHLAFFRAFERGRGQNEVHHAVVDLGTGRVHQGFAAASKGSLATPDGFALHVGPCEARGGGGHDRLIARTPTSALHLAVSSERAATLHHQEGHTLYEVGGFTLYCSRTRMEAHGTLEVDGNVQQVQGRVWFDHQWGRLAPQMNAGWDWFGLQLEDGRDVMLFLRHLGGGRSGIGATVVSQDGTWRCLDNADISLAATAWWTSPHTQQCYASGWVLGLEGERFEIVPTCVDQEFRAGRVPYWEGAANVSGAVCGRAYVELVGTSLVRAGRGTDVT
jgi:predicted secreted hydrolase